MDAFAIELLCASEFEISEALFESFADLHILELLLN